MKGLVFLQPLGGLCNRMRTISSGLAYAQMTNRKLIVVWTRDKSLNAPFSNLFESIPCTIIDCQLDSIRYKVLFHVLCRICNYVSDTLLLEYKNGRAAIKTLSSTFLFIKTCENFMNVEDFSEFKISHQLMERILDISPKTIGIHIRRTDNQMSRRYSPTSLFIKRMDEDIQGGNIKKYYLATDDEAEEKILRERYKECIITYPKRSLSRNDPQAIEDALIDLYHLAHCEKIYGSYYSSFSDVAAMWGKIEKIILKIDE